MLWVKDTQDDNVLHYKESEQVLGTVRYMDRSKNFMAYAVALYLGQYRHLKNAQEAVETKVKAMRKP